MINILIISSGSIDGRERAPGIVIGPWLLIRDVSFGDGIRSNRP